MLLQLIDKETGVHASSKMSRAMEVESHLRVFPIMIENINLSGQMLEEVVFRDCEGNQGLGYDNYKRFCRSLWWKNMVCFVAEVFFYYC